jgi:hypothetical protein
VDVVALPGGFTGNTGGTEEGGREMGLLGESLEEITHQGRHGAVDTIGRSDLQWRHGKRTSLRSIKDAGMLHKRVGVLMKLRKKVVKRTITSVTNACRRSGWQDKHRIQAWAYGGYITKIVMDTFDFYVSLHQHLLQMADVDQAGWDYAHMELEHHIDELSTIRDTADYRLQALCMIYSYLRDGHNGGWYSTELHNKRNLVLLRGRQGGNDDFHCPKCGTSLHGGGRPCCPWKNCNDEQAQKHGQAAIRKLAYKTKGKAKKDDDEDEDP